MTFLSKFRDMPRFPSFGREKDVGGTYFFLSLGGNSCQSTYRYIFYPPKPVQLTYNTMKFQFYLNCSRGLLLVRFCSQNHLNTFEGNIVHSWILTTCVSTMRLGLMKCTCTCCLMFSVIIFCSAATTAVLFSFSSCSIRNSADFKWNFISETLIYSVR